MLRIGDKVINLNHDIFGNEFGTMTIMRFDNIGDAWCRNAITDLEYPRGICQGVDKLSLVTELVEALL